MQSSQRPAPPTSASVLTRLSSLPGPSSTRLSPINLQPCVFLPVNPTPNQPPGNTADVEIIYPPAVVSRLLRPARVDREAGRRRRQAPETRTHHPRAQARSLSPRYRRSFKPATAGPLFNLPSVSFVERIAPGPARSLRQATINWRPPRNCPYFTDFDTPTVATRASIIPCLGLHHRCGLIPTTV